MIPGSQLKIVIRTTERISKLVFCLNRPIPHRGQWRTSGVSAVTFSKVGLVRTLTTVKRATPAPSILDAPPIVVRASKKHGPGIILLIAMPIVSFVLGTWQIYRLRWKTDLIARLEDRLLQAPLVLPSHIDNLSISELEYRRVVTQGKFRHDQEMLLGPRLYDGKEGYYVITPLEREDCDSKVLVNRGWISKKVYRQSDRKDALPTGSVVIEGLLREPWKRNLFSPDNDIAKKQFVFPDVVQMANLTNSTAVWIEQTTRPDLMQFYANEAKGIPIGREAKVDIRNTHTQYIFTWYALSAATAVMFGMVVKRAPSQVYQRVRQSREW